MKRFISLLTVIICLCSFLSLAVSAATPIGGIDGNVVDDGIVDSLDLSELKKVLIGTSEIEIADVNCDGNCDVRDLVALKKYLAGEYKYGDNDYSIYDLEY